MEDLQSHIIALDYALHRAQDDATHHNYYPIIYIFGRKIDTLESTCIKVSDVFPYLYVQKPKNYSIDALRFQINARLNERLNSSDRGEENAPIGFVHEIKQARKTPFYGFHNGDYEYAQISLTHPNALTTLAHLFQSGSITGEPEQVFESHIPYISQFLIDYHLFGCDEICLKSFIKEDNETKASRCSLEFSCFAKDIANKLKVTERPTGRNIRSIEGMPSNAVHLPSLSKIWAQEESQSSIASNLSSFVREGGLSFEAKFKEQMKNLALVLKDNNEDNIFLSKELNRIDSKSDSFTSPPLIHNHCEYDEDEANNDNRLLTYRSPFPRLEDSSANVIGMSLNLSSKDSSYYSREPLVWEYYLPFPKLRECPESDRSKRSVTQESSSWKRSIDAPETSQSDAVPMLILSLEILAKVENDRLPNPEHDPIVAVFWRTQFFGREELVPEVGVILNVKEFADNPRRILRRCYRVDESRTETELIEITLQRINEIDPDVIVGFEIENNSIGYLSDRAKISCDRDIIYQISRMNVHKKKYELYSMWQTTHSITFSPTGRYVLNLWRIIESDAALMCYSFENVCYHLLKKRVPFISSYSLSKMIKEPNHRSAASVFSYYLRKIRLNLEIMDQLELVERFSEQARFIGIDFKDVYARGSQFKVESIMSRMTRPENFILPSPSRKDVAEQDALEYIPLVMEPFAGFYPDPVLVLDFQSLYPSIMIAYNYCFSTCLGKLSDVTEEHRLGILKSYKADLQGLSMKDILIAPNGVLYVKKDVRESLLARMLDEILKTRFILKRNISKFTGRRLKIQNARQKALKLLANVTYGYTSASFSGRMPCNEIADSIVATARAILVETMDFIHSKLEWNAEVVYGDTDSLFVRLRGRTAAQAFKIGEQIAKEVTSRNFDPIALKFEKLYFPCFILAKKRYVGNSYETLQQFNTSNPKFDAKGIETVRRDTTPIEQRILKNSLILFFEHQDIDIVKKSFETDCLKLLNGGCPLSDLLFCKETKLGTYANPEMLPPAALVATKAAKLDKQAAPLFRERVSYLIAAGMPGERLMDRALSPKVFLSSKNKFIDYEYYLYKNILPPLDRLFSLVGCNVKLWIDRLPRPNIDTSKKDSRLWNNNTSDGDFKLNDQNLTMDMIAKNRVILQYSKICASCLNTSVDQIDTCQSLDCSVYFLRKQFE